MTVAKDKHINQWNRVHKEILTFMVKCFMLQECPDNSTGKRVFSTHSVG